MLVSGHEHSYRVWLVVAETLLHFLFGKLVTTAVVHHWATTTLLLTLAEHLQTLGRTKARVSSASLDEFVRVLFVQRQTLGLDVRAESGGGGGGGGGRRRRRGGGRGGRGGRGRRRGKLRWTLVNLDPRPLEHRDEILYGTGNQSCLVRIFNAKNERATSSTCKKVIEKCGAETTNVQVACW